MATTQLPNIQLSDPLTLPCGAQLPNRLAKAAMTEGLATAEGLPTEELNRLYGIWSDGGSGMLLSGNIQIDGDHLERPGNVVIDRPPNAEMQAKLSSWAAAATRNGNHFWAQISHAGRQTMKMVNANPKAPSAVKLGLPGGQFGEPQALTIDEINNLAERFVVAAVAVKEAGFTGVQIHSAHGYLLSQFLSPRVNQRTDDYGGNLENRARMLLDIVKQVRSAVGDSFPVSVKLNSADFQRGGFEFSDSLQVAQWLQAAGIDLLEISGGTYEQPKLLGVEGIEPIEEQEVATSTMAREAYFVDFAMAMKQQLSIPLMVTGGFRLRSAMQEALNSGGADVIGLGRPLCVQTDGPQRLLDGQGELPRYENELSLLPSWLQFLYGIKLIRTIASFANQYWFYGQLDALGKQGAIDPNLSVFKASMDLQKQQKALLAAKNKD